MTRFALTFPCVAGLVASIARADDREALAKKLNNPVATLLSVPRGCAGCRCSASRCWRGSRPARRVPLKDILKRLLRIVT